MVSQGVLSITGATYYVPKVAEGLPDRGGRRPTGAPLCPALQERVAAGGTVCGQRHRPGSLTDVNSPQHIGDRVSCNGRCETFGVLSLEYLYSCHKEGRKGLTSKQGRLQAASQALAPVGASGIEHPPHPPHPARRTTARSATALPSPRRALVT